MFAFSECFPTLVSKPEMITLTTRDNFLFLTPSGRMTGKSFLRDLGARRLKSGTYKLPFVSGTLDRVIDYFDDDITNLDEALELQETAGFQLIDLGQDDHPMWHRLYDYQQDGVDFLVSTPRPGTLLALSPGMGKTIVTAVALDLLEPRNVLIICPPVMVNQWCRELQTWLRLEIADWWSNYPEGDHWGVTTFDTLRSRRNLFASINWDVIVIDESSKIKNYTTERWKAMKVIRKLSPQAKVIELSGTPVTKFADDLWAQLHILWPQGFTSYWRFAETYCEIEETLWGKTIAQNRDDVDIQADLRDIMFVRNQQEELDLPDLRFKTIDVPMTPEQTDLYRGILDDFIIELSSGKQVPVRSKLAQFTKLLQVVSGASNLDPTYSSSSKTDAIIDILISDATEFPVLIWVNWVNTAQDLYAILKREFKVGLVMGGTKDADQIIEDYRRGEYDVLILGLAVGQHGLTLTNTKTIIYRDKTFNMESYVQSLYRVRRIGLEHSPLVYSLRCPGTVDELVEDNLAGKAFSISQISNEDLSDLLLSLSRSLR